MHTRRRHLKFIYIGVNASSITRHLESAKKITHTERERRTRTHTHRNGDSFPSSRNRSILSVCPCVYVAEVTTVLLSIYILTFRLYHVFMARVLKWPTQSFEWLDIIHRHLPLPLRKSTRRHIPTYKNERNSFQIRLLPVIYLFTFLSKLLSTSVSMFQFAYL